MLAGEGFAIKKVGVLTAFYYVQFNLFCEYFVHPKKCVMGLNTRQGT